VPPRAGNIRLRLGARRDTVSCESTAATCAIIAFAVIAFLLEARQCLKENGENLYSTPPESSQHSTLQYHQLN